MEHHDPAEYDLILGPDKVKTKLYRISDYQPTNNEFTELLANVNNT
jgi:hypothetical protein